MTEPVDPQLIDALYESRAHGRPLDYPSGTHLGRAVGLAAQLQVLERFKSDGEKLGGWKVGFTSGASRDRLGVGFRPFGFILESRIRRSGDIVPMGILNCMVEPELCLIMGEPLRGGDIDAQRARKAVRSVAAAFEINEVRVPAGMAAGFTVADAAANWGIVLGDEASPSERLTETVVDLWDGEEQVAHVRLGPALDDPFESLASLCRLLDAHGLGLDAGQPVITGSFAHHRIARPGQVRASFSGVGEVRVQFA